MIEPASGHRAFDQFATFCEVLYRLGHAEKTSAHQGAQRIASLRALERLAPVSSR